MSQESGLSAGPRTQFFTQRGPSLPTTSHLFPSFPTAFSPGVPPKKPSTGKDQHSLLCYYATVDVTPHTIAGPRFPQKILTNGLCTLHKTFLCHLLVTFQRVLLIAKHHPLPVPPVSPLSASVFPTAAHRCPRQSQHLLHGRDVKAAKTNRTNIFFSPSTRRSRFFFPRLSSLFASQPLLKSIVASGRSCTLQ